VIYFDAAYITKCYLNEPGADRVRQLAYSAERFASCGLGRLEFACITKRHLRQHSLTRREAAVIVKEFKQDEKNVGARLA
jgi:predicted nucleic acid-binding protein